MNTIVTQAQDADKFYNAAKDDARILGDNFRTANKRKRTLARNFVAAAVKENRQLEGMIDDCKVEMKFAKLDAADKNQANVFFSALRTIVGKWDKLPADIQEAFLNPDEKKGLVYSTLVTKIKEAQKKAEDAEREAEERAEAGEQARASVNDDLRTEDRKPEPKAVPMVAEMAALTEWLDGGVTPDQMDAAQLIQLKTLVDAIDDFRARVARPVRLAAAA